MKEKGKLFTSCARSLLYENKVDRKMKKMFYLTMHSTHLIYSYMVTISKGPTATTWVILSD